MKQKTPLQQLIEHLRISKINDTEREDCIIINNALESDIELAKSLLPKEKDVIERAFVSGANYTRMISIRRNDIEENKSVYYNQTFETE